MYSAISVDYVFIHFGVAENMNYSHQHIWKDDNCFLALMKCILGPLFNWIN